MGASSSEEEEMGMGFFLDDATLGALVLAFLVSFFLGAGEASESLRAAGARRRLRGVIGSSTSSSEESLIETSAAFLLGSN